MWDTIVVVLLVAVSAWYVLRRYFGSRYSGSCGCASDCAGCGSAPNDQGQGGGCGCSGPGTRAAGLEDFRKGRKGSA